jgi:hypothetical protein
MPTRCADMGLGRDTCFATTALGQPLWFLSPS